jgi:hypothetical protein
VSVTLVITACGDESKPSRTAATDLAIVASDGRGTTNSARVRCNGKPQADGFGGRNAADLCRAAARLERFLVSEPDPRRACTQIYGGPETARVSGTIDGSRVDRRFSRTDGCRISDWERAATLIPLGPR